MDEFSQNLKKDYEKEITEIYALRRIRRELADQRRLLERREKEISSLIEKTEIKLPLDFKIEWWSRRDPFESVYVLYFKDSRVKIADSYLDYVDQRLTLSEYAWAVYEAAIKS